LYRVAPGRRVCFAGRQTLKQWVCLERGAWRREGSARWSVQVSPDGAKAASGDNAVVNSLRVLFYGMKLYLDQEMLCHECVSSWMVVNTWWYERGGSYPVTPGKSLYRMALGGRVCSAGWQTLKQWVCLERGAWRREGSARRSVQVSPGGAEAASGDNVVVNSLHVLFYGMKLYLDQEMLYHERVSSWMVVNTWWYERGGSYPVTFVWGYDRGRFVCFMLTSERCYVRWGT